MRLRRHRLLGRPGVTLPELLLSLAVLALMLGAISGLYLSAIRAWYRQTATDAAHNQARWAVQWLLPVIREARSVDPISSNHYRIQFVQPSAQMTSPAGVTDGDTVAIYLADPFGQYNAAGVEVWFARNGTPVRALARNVVKEDGSAGFEVDYFLTGGATVTDVDAATVQGLTGVQVAITCRGREGGSVRHVTISGSVPLRNLE